MSGWVWEYPGNIQSYNWPEDASQQTTWAYATGSGIPPGQMLSFAVNIASMTAGYPLLESKTSHTDVLVQATLDAHAASALAAYAYPVVIPTIDIRGDLDPVIGSYTVGDEIRLRITDDRFPGTQTGAGLDVTKRITAIAVIPPGTGNETITLTLGDVVP